MLLTVLAQDNPEDMLTRIAGVLFGVAGGIIGILYLLLFLFALISILRSQRLTGGGKFLWIVVALAYPFLGSLGWFIFGKSAQLVKQGTYTG
ncbi:MULTISPECIES: PLDc N-terminal domain-containing protein [unclassified Crossiella]|uniref:PLDc N-terminal domain-containing protein n=1 Tax=unclassified Crossiella TaxID=2620835 RepID=UPI001FFF3ABD|nr:MULTISPECIES: PLDc N-terminal domain-containing protein [unclassified Crossiella]MCK2241933.1 PLDc N-terminal domain-containing protein [Crossiella sp. S99.2]MCK2255836.1 PLDc N-terminal domain-containing protein [Crossiella sp. S99.1]